jgi:hypothetical protein
MRMSQWERAIESFEHSPWMQYAGSEPKYVSDAKARGWARIQARVEAGTASEREREEWAEHVERDVDSEDESYLVDPFEPTQPQNNWG